MQALRATTKTESVSSDELKDTETPKIRNRLIWSVIFLIPLMYISMGHTMWGWKLPSFMENNHIAMGLAQLLLAVIVMVINQKFFINGFKGIIHKALIWIHLLRLALPLRLATVRLFFFL